MPKCPEVAVLLSLGLDDAISERGDEIIVRITMIIVTTDSNTTCNLLF